MKTFRQIGMALLAVLVCVIFASWSAEDDDSTGGGRKESNEKNLAKLIMETSEYAEIYVFSYDGKCRLTEVVSTLRYNEDEDEYTDNTQLVWGDGAVKVSTRSKDYTDNYTVTFEDGLAQRIDVSSGSYRNYCVMTYNKSKRFIKGEEKDGYEVRAIWDGDKLMSISEDGYDTTFAYDETCKKGYFPFFTMLMDIIECDILCMAHPELFGMKTTQLPSSWTISHSYNDMRTVVYECDKDGYLSKVEIKNGEGKVNTIALTWR